MLLRLYFIEVALFLLSSPEDNVLTEFLCACLSVDSELVANNTSNMVLCLCY